jgi:hypothetical protein
MDYGQLCGGRARRHGFNRFSLGIRVDHVKGLNLPKFVAKRTHVFASMHALVAGARRLATGRRHPEGYHDVGCWRSGGIFRQRNIYFLFGGYQSMTKRSSPT